MLLLTLLRHTPGDPSQPPEFLSGPPFPYSSKRTITSVLPHLFIQQLLKSLLCAQHCFDALEILGRTFHARRSRPLLSGNGDASEETFFEITVVEEKQGRGRGWRELGVASLSEGVSFKQRSEQSEGANHVDAWERDFQAEGPAGAPRQECALAVHGRGRKPLVETLRTSGVRPEQRCLSRTQITSLLR